MCSFCIAIDFLFIFVFFMKITVKINNVEITVDEQGQNDRTATIRYSDQNKQIQETIKVMAEECLKLQKVAESTGS